MMKKLLLPILLALGLAVFAMGCGKPFDVKTAPGFIELEHQEPTYQYRATTPEGVVVGVQVIELEGDNAGDLAFWTRAITLQVRDVQGYALVETRDVKSRDGTPGKELRFGHDEDNKPFVYRLTVYVKQKRLFMVEAGGTLPNFDKYEKSVQWMSDTLLLK
ncbi:hypothetical protein BH09MYX1_BH09MYX1_32410 [soil metagenome]